MAEHSPPSSEVERPKKKQRLEAPTFRDPMSTIVLKTPLFLERFMVHEEVACLYSPVIAKAVLESENNNLEFNTRAPPQVVRRFVQWLYTQNLVLHFYHEDPCDKYCRGLRHGELLDLVGLWITAKELKIPSLQDQIIRAFDVLYQEHGCSIFFEYIPKLYERTRPKCALRKYFVALCARGFHRYRHVFDEDMYTLPNQFVIEIADHACTKLSDAQKSYNLSDYLCNPEEE
ncbi:uncharacterized protein PAC_00990 [Phialocephala subalpina]|uniref:BTB domain-containing protein n=1 Tax=Phialocephala subalpina TaxID=576137 RepID=A0A1L7WEA3_9HELO|nr:uncharacterized protein PAC_00990 [Phialocephala subalpina]